MSTKYQVTSHLEALKVFLALRRTQRLAVIALKGARNAYASVDQQTELEQKYEKYSREALRLGNALSTWLKLCAEATKQAR